MNCDQWNRQLVGRQCFFIFNAVINSLLKLISGPGGERERRAESHFFLSCDSKGCLLGDARIEKGMCPDRNDSAIK